MTTTPAHLQNVLDRFDRVEQVGPNQYKAGSPLREDRNPSLFIGINDEGVIAVHDHGHAGDVTDILSAVGLTFADLFPPGEFGAVSRPKQEAGDRPIDRVQGTNPRVARAWRRFAKAMTPDRLSALGKSLGVPTTALHGFDVGWDQKQQAWAILETSRYGAPIGIQFRHQDGRKSFLPGGKRGLVGAYQLGGSDTRTGRLFITEGFSDAVALASLGTGNVIGRPSCNGHVHETVDLIRTGEFGDVVIVGDPKPQEVEGAKRLRDAIAKYAPACVIVPPQAEGRRRDLRDWVRDGASRADIEKAIGTTDTGRYRLFGVGDVLRLPDPAWLVEGVIGDDDLVVLYGPEKTFKSFVALDLVAAVQSGREWEAGYNAKAKQGQVIYVAAEGQGGIKKRVHALLAGYRQQKASEHQMTALRDLKFVFNRVMVNSADADRLVATLKALRVKPAVIVLDTLARTMRGDENTQKDMGEYIEAIDRIKAEFGCTVIVIHHTPKTGHGMRGSSALGGACDVAIHTERANPRSLELRVVCDYAKDAEPFPDVYVRMEHEYVPAGAKQETSLRVVPSSEEAWRDDNKQGKSAGERGGDRDKVLAYVAEHPGCGSGELSKVVSVNKVRALLDLLIESGDLIDKGAGNRRRLYPAEPVSESVSETAAET
jgi:hypothetical protein